jgi:hypothetical protein
MSRRARRLLGERSAQSAMALAMLRRCPFTEAPQPRASTQFLGEVWVNERG